MKFLDYLLLERNIINIDAVELLIDDLLADLAAARAIVDVRTNFGKIEKWIKSNLKNFILRNYNNVQKLSPTDSYVTNKAKKEPWIQKAINRGDELYAVIVTVDFRSRLAHVMDFFIANQNVNISRMSVPEAIRQSKEWTLALNKKAAGEDDPEGIKEIRKYPDGFRWVKVISQQALDREGKLMRHCVGSYCDRVSSGSSIIYSLRDKKNQPHCTVEVTSNNINQIQGKANGLVDQKYLKYVKDFITEPVSTTKWGFVDNVTLENVGLIEIRGSYYGVNNMSSSEKKVLVDELMNMLFNTPGAYDKRWACGVLEELDLDRIFDQVNSPGNIVYHMRGADKTSIKSKIKEILGRTTVYDLVEFYRNYSRGW